MIGPQGRSFQIYKPPIFLWVIEEHSKGATRRGAWGLFDNLTNSVLHVEFCVEGGAMGVSS